MCITFVLVNTRARADEWKLVIANNRDEFYQRPTSKANWRDNDVLCGERLDGYAFSQ